jgi:fructose-bisphosphate aldolase, class II
MLVTMKKLLDVAKGKHYAVPAPNVYSLETVEAAFQAARELKAPMIMNVWDDGAEWIAKVGNIVRYFDPLYPDVICALNLDHGHSFATAMAAIRAGYTSVMADFSMMPFNDNAAEVRRIVDVAHAVNVSVEAELGHVGQGFEYESTRDKGLTNPGEAVSYVEQTHCDMLAVAIGTSHGVYKGTPRIDFELLETLSALVSVPLVLHGGSGTGDENLAKAVNIGIQKVNICTDLFNGYDAAVREAGLEDGANYLSRYFAGPMGWKKTLIHYTRLFNAAGKAPLYELYTAMPEEMHYQPGSEYNQVTY